MWRARGGVITTNPNSQTLTTNINYITASLLKRMFYGYVRLCEALLLVAIFLYQIKVLKIFISPTQTSMFLTLSWWLLHRFFAELF